MKKSTTRNPPKEHPGKSSKHVHSDKLHHGSASSTTSLRKDNQHSSTPQFEVFISHAGADDKATIAIPLRKMLAKKGIKAFVDDCDIRRGTDAIEAMERAMNTAHIAVFVLSPEFVARKWPIKELMHFLKRYKECKRSGREFPVLIPFFYRLSIEEMYNEPNLDRVDKDGNNLHEKSRFYQRQARGELEADPVAIKKALRSMHAFMGVENILDANNDSSHKMSQRRDLLLKMLYKGVKVASRTKEGKVKDQDVSKSSEWNAEDGMALNRYADIFRDGTEGAERNAKKAAKLYRLAIEAGHVCAMNNLANLLVKGADGVEQNAKEAAKFYCLAIEAGHVRAMNNLANLLVKGADGVERDAKEAVKLYHRAIDGGSDLAMNNLANLLAHGSKGVERSAKEAVKLYRRAIDGGSILAMNNLANLLAHGADGVKRNEKEAAELYRRAIRHGHVGAKNNLANLLRRATVDVTDI